MSKLGFYDQMLREMLASPNGSVVIKLAPGADPARIARGLSNAKLAHHSLRQRALSPFEVKTTEDGTRYALYKFA